DIAIARIHCLLSSRLRYGKRHPLPCRAVCAGWVRRVAARKQERALTTDSLVAPKPGNSMIRIDPGGRPWIEGFRCVDCGAVVTERTMACRRCASRNPLQGFRAGEAGK